MVTGKLDGIFPPMLLLLRSLPPKYIANSKEDAEEIYMYYIRRMTTEIHELGKSNR